MGTAPSTPVPIVTYEGDKIIYDGSIYTGNSASMMVQDFPWVIWLEKGAVLSENF